ncbi:hypothetical protein [Sphingomonas solaris]|uniref:Uncharacterized protein n=1 Tax=Alterirhizorhabdus solaris TaxID=2529389 RepID=A0A558QYB8_9SPHN|nr:hypothetical protein [Sphingomonas solaris]TVV72153.1 hypothetical protein FOY91_15185 [Sphingomonas solaris]
MMAARFRSVTWVAVAVVPALACYLVTQHVAAERAQLAKVERQIGQSRRAIRELETELGTRGSMAQIERWNGQTFALAAPSAQQFITGDVQLASLSALPALPVPAVVMAAAPAASAPSGPAPSAPAEVRQATLETVKPAAPVHPVRQASFEQVKPAASARPLREASFEAAKPAARPLREATSKTAAKASTPARATPAKAEVRQVAFKPARRAAPVEEEAQPLLRQATYVKPPREQKAPTKVAMLANGPLDSRSLAEIGRIANAERGSRRP